MRLASVRNLVLIVVATFVLSASQVWAAETIKQAVTPTGVALRVTGWNESTDKVFEGYELDLRCFTPEFQGTVSVPGKIAAVLVVSNGKVQQILNTENGVLPTAPAIPADGFLLVGSGVGNTFMKNFQVGDDVSFVEKAATTLQPAPTVIITMSGATYDISGMNRGRRASEMILYTSDFGSYTLTNGYGIEVAVKDGEVVAKRAYGDNNLFAIPDGGYVLSGHLEARFWLDSTLKVGDLVELQ